MKRRIKLIGFQGIAKLMPPGISAGLQEGPSELS
jgi:hypothetical protein